MGLKEQFDELTAESIRAYIADRREEDLHLDFKQVSHAALNGSDDRRNLAKAISGFANADGGIIVWGVVAKRNERGINCATETKHIDGLDLFASKLNEHSGAAVNPIAEGVIHRKLIEAGDRGFAATLIPSSDGGPHMAKLGEDRYYKCTGDRFAKMEHYEIQDMFGRRRRPVLKLSCVVEIPNRTLIIAILNVGRGSAVAPYLAIRVNSPHHLDQFGLDGYGNPGLPQLLSADKATKHFGSGMDTVIHPGTFREVTKIIVDSQPELLRVEFALSAEGIQVKERAITLERYQLSDEGAGVTSE